MRYRKFSSLIHPAVNLNLKKSSIFSKYEVQKFSYFSTKLYKLFNSKVKRKFYLVTTMRLISYRLYNAKAPGYYSLA